MSPEGGPLASVLPNPGLNGREPSPSERVSGTSISASSQEQAAVPGGLGGGGRLLQTQVQGHVGQFSVWDNSALSPYPRRQTYGGPASRFCRPCESEDTRNQRQQSERSGQVLLPAAQRGPTSARALSRPRSRRWDFHDGNLELRRGAAPAPLSPQCLGSGSFSAHRHSGGSRGLGQEPQPELWADISIWS